MAMFTAYQCRSQQDITDVSELVWEMLILETSTNVQAEDHYIISYGFIGGKIFSILVFQLY
jgi:hypothetical protein